MKKTCVLAFAVLLIVCASTTANALLIFQSGDPIYSGAAYPFNDDTRIAGRFTLGNPYTISGSELFMYSHASSANNLFNIVFYGDTIGGQIPDSSNVLGRFESNGPKTTPSSFEQADWYGRKDLNLNLNAGAYWVGYEVDDGSGQDLKGNVPFLFDIPPSTQYAKQNYFNPDYIPIAPEYGNEDGKYNDYPGFGFRVYGEPSSNTAIPEPATAILFGAGVFCTFMRRKLRV